MVEMVRGVGICVGVCGVGNRGGSAVSGGEKVSVADSGGARWRDCSESSGRTSHVVFYSRSISVMCFCRLACKEEVDKVIEALIYQRVGRSVGGRKDLSGLHGLEAISRVGSKVLKPLLGCEGVFSLQLR